VNPPEVKATCPDCNAGNAIRAGNAMDQIYCGRCGWVTDESWSGPGTRSELREQLQDERDTAKTPGLTVEDIQVAIRELSQ